ncbi:THO complex subunit 1 [Coccinella septempunctata]|uniref:THO complex subunit 1 n=1 Tax=Coccinella septempunctata TaxID=41139 RepID=UPI001D065676|nr:THO complex subunit 1 [Coccinella septempunctata]
MSDLNFETLRTEFKTILLQAFKNKNVETIKTKSKHFKKTDIDLKIPLEQAFRDILIDFLESETDVNTLKTYVNFCIETCRHGLITSTLPVQILSDILEALTLDACQDMFSFVEDNVSVWKEELFFSGCKNNLLRLCNDLLRRLSRSTATIFCGRILLFLAKFFPFSERSGLNIVSEFNLENTTQYGSDSSQESTLEIETGDKKKNVVLDFTFYCKFWSLQDFFRYPAQCYDKVQWKTFCSHSQSILSIFQGLKLEYAGKGNTASDRKDMMYFSKYLTSQKLLDLQLYDNNFRRFVLLQFLILFQYLTCSVKFKSESFELKSDQKDWIQSTTEKIYKLLRETPPDGEKFAEIVSNILSREEHWNAWKNDGCPEFKKQSVVNEPIEKSQNRSSRPLLGDLLRQANKEKKYYMGSNELTKLWNLCPDNLEACKGKERDFLPTLENYFKEAIEQIESGEIIKDENNLLKDGNFGWRALRLLARRSPHFFTFSTVIMNQQSSYLEMMVKKIAQEQKSKKDGVNNKDESQQDTEEMETENLFKEESENTEDIKEEVNTEEFVDDKNPRQENKSLSESQIRFISEKIASDWKKLATKIGYKPDEIEFIVQNHNTELAQAENLLLLWFGDDEDATIENLLYILEGLGLNEACDSIKSEFNIS